MEIHFKRDTAFRKTFFVPDSFSHPAKMDAQLLIWIIEKYTQPGETILDPMAGSGTTMLACTLGRNVVLVELEQKFCKMMHDNWEKVLMRPQLGSTMGNCQIIQGDARQLEELLANHIITSPPYSDMSMGGGLNTKSPREGHNDQSGRSPDSPSQKGLVDKIVTSPPYAEAQEGGGISALMRGKGSYKLTTNLPASAYQPSEAGQTQGNIGNLPYGEIDKIVTSDKGQSESDMSVVYITFFEVDNPIALLVKTLVPSSIFGSLAGRTMPEIAISLNDSSKGRQEEINRISTNGELTNKLNSLFAKVFGNRAFKAREPSFSVTLQGTEDTSITVDAVGLDIEGVATESTIALYTGSAGGNEALHRTDPFNTSFVLVKSYPELLIADRAISPETSNLSTISTGTGAILTSVSSQFTRSAVKDIPAFLANFCDPNHLAHLLTPLSIIPQISSIITSPPYEGSVSASTGGERDQSSARQREQRLLGKGYDPAKYQGGVGRNLEVDFQYSDTPGNIGNLKSDSYLEAMLQVYQQCFSILKNGGLLILVTKNFIRNKQIIRLDTDTINLCEQAGFSFVERHYRLLPSQSFWRIIYHRRHPDVEQINHEDVLVFTK